MPKMKAETPAREVTVYGFYISKFEVTQELFESVMGSSMSDFQGADIPVNNLSWQAKTTACQPKPNGSLPQKAETRAKALLSNNIEDVAWYADNAKNQAHPVGQKKPNELGLYDMTGNVLKEVVQP
ncbi:formylglycine-generating enzyme family protein [Vibrio alfacsensis]|uniref:formylglycine-generating enzyme family protein n=1 Tax=Vibrio alfacsensis TaxID=1074311 RepID=UPI0040692E0D